MVCFVWISPSNKRPWVHLAQKISLYWNSPSACILGFLLSSIKRNRKYEDCKTVTCPPPVPNYFKVINKLSWNKNEHPEPWPFTSHPGRSPTHTSLLLRTHSPRIQLLQLPVQLLQLTARGSELALHLGGTPPARHRPPKPFCRFLDLQLPLDLLSELRASIFQALLEHRVQDVTLSQAQQARALPGGESGMITDHNNQANPSQDITTNMHRYLNISTASSIFSSCPNAFPTSLKRFVKLFNFPYCSFVCHRATTVWYSARNVFYRLQDRTN